MKHGTCIVAVYVDNILIMGSSDKFITNTEKVLKATFEMKELGVLWYFLVMEVIKT